MFGSMARFMFEPAVSSVCDLLQLFKEKVEQISLGVERGERGNEHA